VITKINRVILVGKDEYLEKKTSFRHTLEHNELIFHFSGQLTVFFDDEHFEVKPNTIRFLPKCEPKRYDVLRKEGGECIDVFFEADRPISERAFIFDVKSNEKLGMLFRKLFATWVGKNEGYYFDSISILYKIFAEMQKESYVPREHYLKIKPAVDHIHDRFAEDAISLKALSEMCGMKESYFERLFKEKYGVSPKKYIIQLKINHACELLRLGRYSITQVAELCNFSDVYIFSRQFKEYMGITPSEFITKYRSSK
jgi:AraC-like DNA-binding protein